MTEITYLDPEIANEGEPATNWTPGSGPAPIPDMVKLLGNHKHFGKYFAPRVFMPFPAWIYHKTEPDKMVKNAREAREYGVSYVTDEAGGNGHYQSTGEWKTFPLQKKKPLTNGAGKNVITSERAQGGASLEIMTQILQQMQKGQAAPPVLNEVVQSDPDYAAFIEFKKWKEAQAAPAAVLSDAEQKEILVGLAKERDIHVDKRWSLDRLKAELDKAD